MSETKTFIMWSLILIICLMVLGMTVFIADSVMKLPDKIGGETTVLPEITPVSGENGFPYTVSYKAGTVHVKNSKGTEVYSFSLSGYTLPESELKLLSEGITFETMDDVWALIESYTS